MIWDYVRVRVPHPENRRRFRRHATQYVRLEIDRRSSYVLDISERGIRISGGPRWIAEGQGLGASLIFPTLTKDIRIPVFGKVLRQSDDGMILVYPPPIPEWKRSLETLIGAMA